MVAEARGSVYARGNVLWLAFKVNGKRVLQSSGYRLGEEAKARAALARIRDRIAAGEAMGVADLGPVTVSRFAEQWVTQREQAGVRSWKSDATHLRTHVLPLLGPYRLEDVRPRHLADLLATMRREGSAPRSVRNVYSTCRSMFRDAVFADLIPHTPATLTRQHIGPIRDRDSEWRESALFTRAEVEGLISDDRIPEARRFLWALFALTGMRHGEVAGLRFRHLDMEAKPLGRILVATSYDSGRTKTGAERRVPIHPVLASMLAEWRLHHWSALYGHQPCCDDLVVPSLRGKMRHTSNTLRFLHLDLATLGMRQRRVHDFRRTYITLAQEHGALPEVLKLATHAKPSDVFNLYTSVSWERLCGEVAKLQVERRKSSNLLVLTPGAATPALLQSSKQTKEVACLANEARGTRTHSHRLKRPMLYH